MQADGLPVRVRGTSSTGKRRNQSGLEPSGIWVNVPPEENPHLAGSILPCSGCAHWSVPAPSGYSARTGSEDRQNRAPKKYPPVDQ